MLYKVKNLLLEERNQLLMELNDIEEALKQLPNGIIFESSCRGITQYHWKRHKEDKTRNFLSKKKDSGLIQDLAQRRYLENLKKADQNNIALINRILELLSLWESKDQVLNRLPKGIKSNASPKAVGTENFVETWLSNTLADNYQDDGRIFLTKHGEWVRSKSEREIADYLYDSHLPYKYEEPLWLGTHRVLPDFTILDPRSREEVYYEHFGMMGDMDYATRSTQKIIWYSRAGYQLGNRFLCSMESRDQPAQTDQVRAMLEDRFHIATYMDNRDIP